MNRREFLRILSLSAAAATAPRIIFDMGANSHLYVPHTSIYNNTFIIEDLRFSEMVQEMYNKYKRVFTIYGI